eukprot:TRINITY_DN113274_c0_g1_i1.p1 TRINITY_DN113274_c0_g1~~TRINITY_DN113274_c0_g1_i1.p1  ORF type:complete len:334 (+),score=78.85 TRINITY_DN113274_c0_g1_i1:87-1088(+)
MSAAAARLAALRARIKQKEDDQRKQREESAVARAKEEHGDEVMEQKSSEEGSAAKRARLEGDLSSERPEGAAAASFADIKPPACGCGEPAVLRKVEKEGPHLGRNFFACRLDREAQGQCRFFLWAVLAQRPSLQLDLANTPTPQKGAGAASMQEPRKCRCGMETALRTVKKEGPNLNRRFWACVQPEQCDFFAWEEAPAGPSDAAGAEPVKRCKCGMEAGSRTVKKEGPNLNRKFWCCVQPEQCKYFEWDPVPETATPAATRSPDAASGAGASPSEAGVKCARCSADAGPLLTVKKAGPNCGRRFRKCSAGHFQWEDEGPPSKTGQAAAGRGA